MKGVDRLFRGSAGTLLFARIYTALVVLAVGLGIVVLGGKGDRFSSPGFSGPRDLVSIISFAEPWQVWGTFFLIYGFGLVMGVGRRFAIWLLYLGMGLYTFFAISLAASVLASPIVAATGVVAYAVFFAIHAFLADYLSEAGWE